METSNSAPISESQPRKRRGRNSDIRKEQNRIASRAYREKRRQKLALLDEILKSDNHNDSMSSVSDETEYNSTTPAPDFRTMESARRTRNSSHSPAPYYMSAVPALPSVTAGVQPLPSNGPGCDADAYGGYSVKDYVQEAERLATHAPISAIGMGTSYAPPLPPIAGMPSAPMFPFDEEFMGDAFGAYPLPDGGSVPGFTAPPSGYDSNMINALQSLSRLDDSQQQQIMAYLQKKRNVMQATATGPPLDLGGYGTYHHVPVPPRSSPLPGHLQRSGDATRRDGRLP
ncbi:hypothetical protein F5Y12DRAFT_358090 [Xylaria sp. FL1777]|nr:hypothetical protein F5Y12DRAFT_358090 [Xylaria sp. FL1777]